MENQAPQNSPVGIYSGKFTLQNKQVPSRPKLKGMSKVKGVSVNTWCKKYGFTVCLQEHKFNSVYGV